MINKRIIGFNVVKDVGQLSSFFVSRGENKLWSPDKKIIKEYELSLKELRKEKNKRKTKKEEFKVLGQTDQWTKKMEVELTLVSGMVSNMEYSLYWMKNGVERKSVRGISNKSYEQRTEYWGDISIAVPYHNITEKYFSENEYITDVEDDKKIERYISCLSKREREAFIYIVIEGHTYEKTATYMGISRSAVQAMINRSKVKIKKLLSAEKEVENTELIES